MSACGLEKKGEEENGEYIMVSNVEPISTIDYVKATLTFLEILHFLLLLVLFKMLLIR